MWSNILFLSSSEWLEARKDRLQLILLNFVFSFWDYLSIQNFAIVKIRFTLNFCKNLRLTSSNLTNWDLFKNKDAIWAYFNVTQDKIILNLRTIDWSTNTNEANSLKSEIILKTQHSNKNSFRLIEHYPFRDHFKSTVYLFNRENHLKSNYLQTHISFPNKYTKKNWKRGQISVENSI